MFATGIVNAQHTYNPKALIPLDPAYKIGTLANGIKYILRGDLSDKKAYFYAFYNVGAIQEEPKEYGIAHLLEHLCFAGKKSYLDYFNNKGMGMGEYINAGTAMERTAYTIFKVPTEQSNLVDSTLLLLRALSFTIDIKPQELEKERKIVLEEWRLEQDANARMCDKIEKLALKGSRYSRSSILGDTTVINHCTLNEVKNFFTKWYRPDNLTIIVIGDFDAVKMEGKIKQFFSSVPKAEGKSPRVFYPIPDNKEPIINIVSDPEASTGEIEIHYKHNSPTVYNQEQLRTEYIDRMIDNMFDNRLEKIIGSSNAPFAKANASYGSNYFHTPSYDEYSCAVTTYKDIKIALKAILTENERIIKYGFTDAELQNSKNFWLRNSRPNQKEIKYPYDEYFVHCYYFILKGKTMPSSNFGAKFGSSMYPTITLAEVNNRFKSYTSNNQPVISITCPQKDIAAIPTESDIKNMLATIRLQKLEPFHIVPLTGILFKKKVKPGVVIKQTVNIELGTTEWLLSNGMRIVFKPTDFKADEIQFQAKLKLDSLRLKEEYFSTIMYASKVVKKMGVDRFSANELKQMLKSKHVSVSPEANFTTPIQGKSTPKDFETALQLINLYYSNQRWDDNVLSNEFQYYKSYAVEQSGLAAFDDTIRRYWSYNSKEKRSLNHLSYKDASMEKLKKINQYIYNNPAVFTIFFAGSIKPETVKPLIEKYLGSLTANRDSILKDEIFLPKAQKSTEKKIPWYETGIKSCEFKFPMKTPSASVYVCCQGKTEENRAKNIYGELALSLFVQQCGNVIRGKYGASYSVSLFDRMMGNESWQGHVYFQTDPKLADQMKEVALDEMKRFMEGDINEREYNILKTKMITKRTNELKTNEWWINNALPEFYFRNKNIVPIYIDEVNNLTLEGLKSFTRNVYKQRNIIDVVMKSE